MHSKLKIYGTFLLLCNFLKFLLFVNFARRSHALTKTVLHISNSNQHEESFYMFFSFEKVIQFMIECTEKDMGQAILKEKKGKKKTGSKRTHNSGMIGLKHSAQPSMFNFAQKDTYFIFSIEFCTLWTVNTVSDLGISMISTEILFSNFLHHKCSKKHQNFSLQFKFRPSLYRICSKMCFPKIFMYLLSLQLLYLLLDGC